MCIRDRSKLNYMGDYTFAFDDPKYQTLLDKKLVIMKKYVPQPWRLKFYIYYHPSMDIGQMLDRAEWCRKNLCKPYVMRDIACWEMDTKTKEFLIDFTAYCNQPAMFKKLTFEEFLYKRYTRKDRIDNSLEIYNRYRRCD